MGRSSGGGGRSAGAGSSGGSASQTPTIGIPAPRTVRANDVVRAFNSRPDQGDIRMTIADLKDSLGVQDNSEIHGLLRSMQQQGRVSLRRIEDPSEITARMRAAAIDFGSGDIRPFIWVRG